MMDAIFDAALTSITAHRVKRLIGRKTSYRRCGLQGNDGRMPVECPPLLAGLPKHSLTAFESCAALFLGLLTCGQITRPDVLLPESHRNPDRFRLGPHGANESRRECDPLHTGYGTATLPWSVANWAGARSTGV
jgi:hypothetical protein